MNIFQVLDRNSKIARLIRETTGECWVSPFFCNTRLHVRPRIICEASWSRVLSNAVLNRMFPPERDTIELDHYTKFAGFEGIVSSGQLRLYWIRKRVSEHEITSFAAAHRLQGYVSTNNRSPVYIEISEELFYCSFTRPGAGNEQQLWNDFGGNDRGVRLRFRLTPGAADLRPMYYEGRKPTLLATLNEQLETETGRIFLPHSISKICAFYLPLGYQDEAEVRLLLKKTPHLSGWGFDGYDEYCAVPIDQKNPICALNLVRIAPGNKADRQAIVDVLSRSQFSSVPVT